MSRIYTDYINKIALSVPDKYIDVKTGETYSVSPKIEEQIEYHAKNDTLIHLVFSALHCYLKPKSANGVTAEILHEILEIKKMMKEGCIPIHQSPALLFSDRNEASKSVDMRDVEDVLEAFGG